MERHVDVSEVVFEGFLADAAEAVGLGGFGNQLSKPYLTN